MDYMDFSSSSMSQHLTFLEANILIENLRGQRRDDLMDKGGLLVRLVTLVENTSDPILLKELDSLKDKVMSLSEEEFESLRKDVLNGDILSSPHYKLPNFSE